MYCDPYSILVVTNLKRLIRLKCPFQVQANMAVDKYQKDESLNVQLVRIDREGQLVYEIDHQFWHYSIFRICILE